METPKKRPVRSIDGMVSAGHALKHPRRNIYISKDKPTVGTKTAPNFISLQPRGGMDGFTARRVPKQPPKVALASNNRPKLPTIPDQDVVMRLPRQHSLRARLTSVLQYAVFTIIALIAAYSTTVGQWFILLYALYVLIRRADASFSFGAALLVLVSVPIFQLLHQPGVANNMAVYVYELLVVGTLQAIITLKWSRHKQDDV